MFLVLFLMMYGVSGTDTDESEPVSVMEGDSVTLHTDLTELLNDDTILWLFGPKHSLISQIKRKGDLTSFSFTSEDVRFRGRLQVDENTGSLTIRNTRITHSGQYKLSISREKTTTKIFNVTVSDMVGETEAVKSVSVTEGESVTLNTDAEMHKDALMLWRFGDKGIILAKIDIETNKISLNNTDEKFRDRLQLNQNGSLTIRNTRTTDSGFYELQIRGSESSQRFLLSVNGDMAAGTRGAEGAAKLIYHKRYMAVYLFNKIPYSPVSNKNSIISTHEHISVLCFCVADEAKTMTEVESFTEIQDTDIEWRYKPEENLFAEINRETIRTVAVSSVSVKEGDPAHLPTTAKIQPGDLILWMFGADGLNRLLLYKADSKITDINERFRGRLKLDKTTGALIIKNSRPTDSGYYILQIINKEQTTFNRLNVTVTDSSGDRVNEPMAEMSPLLNGDAPDGENEQQSSV
ncbi:unnamed protein product [Leuciscus chuanchicus]